MHPQKDITAHAEIDAIRNAGKQCLMQKIKNEKFTIYSTLEPCPMCTGVFYSQNTESSLVTK